MISWCVAHTQPLKESVSQQHLLDQGMDDKSRVQLLLTFMGREMKMTLPTYAVEAA